jgi:hypothetical protein
MGENEAFIVAAKQVMELMKEIRCLAREEYMYAKGDKAYPENREINLLKKNRSLKQAMRDMSVKYQVINKCGGELHRRNAQHIMELLKDYFRETIRIVQEVHSCIMVIMNEVCKEIRTVGMNKKALTAYGIYR